MKAEVLRLSIEEMNNKKDLEVVIEGHANLPDSTPEFNMATGQRRAAQVQYVLIGGGIDPERVHTISYGEKRDLVPTIWDERVNFVLQ